MEWSHLSPVLLIIGSILLPWSHTFCLLTSSTTFSLVWITIFPIIFREKFLPDWPSCWLLPFTTPELGHLILSPSRSFQSFKYMSWTQKPRPYCSWQLAGLTRYCIGLYILYHQPRAIYIMFDTFQVFWQYHRLIPWQILRGTITREPEKTPQVLHSIVS